MPLAILVIDRDAALQKRRQSGGIERLVDRHREQRLGLVEQESPVAVGTGDQRLARRRREGKGPLHLGLRPLDQVVERGPIEPLQDQHLRSAQERRIQLERRILGGRADQSDGAVLDIGQEAVLLRAIEAVDFVHEQQCALAGPRMLLRLGEHLLEIGHTREHRRDRHETQPDRIGEQPRDRRLAGAGRAPQDDRRQFAGRDHSPDRALGSGDVILPDNLGQRSRAQPIGKRRIGRRRFGGGRIEIGKQVSHRLGT